jgi:dipeptidyl aminopeptidase/acylaminoacyl peptidase
MKLYNVLFWMAWLLAFPVGSRAQLTAEDYQRADSTIKFNDLVYHAFVNPTWIDSTSTCWYSVKTRKGTEYLRILADKQKKVPAFDQEKLCARINEQTGKKYSPWKLQLAKLSFSHDQKEITFELEGYTWKCELTKYTLTKQGPVKKPDNRYWAEREDETDGKPVASPDSLWFALIKNYNVYLKDRKTNQEFQLSYDGSAGDYYSSYLAWSPDSKHLAVNKIRKNEKHYIYFIESSPKDQLQPILQKRDYLKPGDALPIKRPALFDVATRSQVPVDSAPFENQYDLSGPSWRKDSRAFTFEFNQRGHQVYQVVEVDAVSGKIKILIDERSKTFVEYSGKHFRYDVNDGRELIWMSERDGWNHLYLIDGASGAVKNPITKGDWVVREVVHVDEKNREIIFAGSGRNPGEAPYFIHYYKVGFDGSGLVDLTPEQLNHSATFSSDYKYLIDNYSSVNVAPTTVLRDATSGKLLMELEKADIDDLLATGWQKPEVFVAKARDGKTDIWGNIYRPTNFDPKKSYPVIEYIYAGPQGSFAQKTFRPFMSPFTGLCELGFIIVQLDGMGTSNRSKAFHDVCYKNLKDAGFPDRILWIKAAAKKYAYMDTTRVGLFGGSAGGQNTLAGLLFHPEFYKAGSASCGCHDNRMDKMWWNEQWMGYPIGPEYAECSNVVNAPKLEGKLLLIVGEVDDNVDPASTMQVADALIKAKKDFELVVLPGVNHTLGGDFGERKRRDFFVKTFLHEETPDWNSKK